MRLSNVVAFGFIITLGVFSSCKKDIADKPAEPAPTPPVKADTLSAAKLKDSTLIYTRDIYLWYKQIPASFNPQTFEDPKGIMTAIRAYSVETGYSTPVDRWSFAMKKTEWNNMSMGISSTSEEDQHDFGLNVFFRADNDLRVRQVEKASPAGLAGIRRGWRITRINGSSNINTANSSLVVKGVYESENSTFTFVKPDGSSVDMTLKAAGYQENPVVLDSVYTEGGKKVGYLVFNSFLGDTAQIYRDLSAVFSRFGEQQVKELIVDLRYNGGGYVNVQEKLANYIINASSNGQIMMQEKFNDKYTSFNNTTLFAKAGNVNATRVSFIVSNLTASASELLINNLRPYMDVRIVGPSKTHGKPVGYFPIPVGDWYVFPVSFRTVNKNGESDYFGGLSLTNQVADGIDKDWGDRNESALGYILNGLKNGNYRTDGTTEASVDPRIESINTGLKGNIFEGTIDSRIRF
ncbi:S41 family peptidase [Segetibacter sp. 3557_3]|uniref:S41 family peptidase n=1 Tax=Segetibacter sp. 3557_3 TaxID=2547429 RepID=UPI0014053E91|nr:S41 family peptidase [Segetibacter sp. 3557_3]